MNMVIEKLLFKTNDWLKQKICIPSFTEQQQIANMLTIWDKGIELKEKLIAQKKVKNKWLMRNLLTGEKRLSGFSGEWKETGLGDLAQVIMGQSPSSNFYNDCGNGLPLIQGNADCIARKVEPRIWTTEITKT